MSRPEVWLWDFDDGTTIDEASPVHTFDPGLYHVCLTVSNSYDTDSSCQWVEILTTSNEDVQGDTPDLSISPNPFSEALVIQSLSGHIRQTHLQLYDMHGQLVLDQPNAPVPVSIFLPSLPPGMYLCRIAEGDGTLYNFKVLKQ